MLGPQGLPSRSWWSWRHPNKPSLVSGLSFFLWARILWLNFRRKNRMKKVLCVVWCFQEMGQARNFSAAIQYIVNEDWRKSAPSKQTWWCKLVPGCKDLQNWLTCLDTHCSRKLTLQHIFKHLIKYHLPSKSYEDPTHLAELRHSQLSGSCSRLGCQKVSASDRGCFFLFCKVRIVHDVLGCGAAPCRKIYYLYSATVNHHQNMPQNQTKTQRHTTHENCLTLLSEALKEEVITLPRQRPDCIWRR